MVLFVRISTFLEGGCGKYMLQIAICDDERIHLANTKRLTAEILSTHNPKISEFVGANDLLFKMEGTGYCPDIALLDIQMPDVDGISLANEINRIAPDCKIIFITSYIGYAADVYDTDHIYLVIKSQLDEKLPNALNKALASLAEPKSFVLIKNGALVRRIPAEDVLYLERDLHKTIVITSDGSYKTSQSPADLLSTLSARDEFIQCHQSYWVSLRAVATMEANAFKLCDGTIIPISRARKADAKRSFFSFVSNSVK